MENDNKSKIDVSAALTKLAQEKSLTQEELEVKLRSAISRDDRMESIEAIAQTATENIAKLAETIAKKAEIDAQLKTEDAYDYLAKEFSDKREKLTIEERRKLSSEIIKAGELSAVDAQTLMFGSTLEQKLFAPLKEGSNDYESTKSFRDIVDAAQLRLAIKDGIKRYSGSGTEEIKFDSGALKDTAAWIRKHSRSFDSAAVELFEKTLLDTQTAGGASEWVPGEQLTRNLVDLIWLRAPVAGLFPRMNMDSPIVAVPRRDARAEAYLVDEPTVVADYLSSGQANLTVNNKLRASSYESGKVVFNARTMGVLSFISDQLMEDATPAAFQLLLEDMAFAQAYGIDNFAINGSRATNDLDNTGSDGDRLWANTATTNAVQRSTGVADIRYLTNGIRKRALANPLTKLTMSGVDLSRRDLSIMQAKLGNAGVDTQSNLAYVMGPQEYIRLILIDEFATAEKYNRPTNTTGALTSLNGIDVFVSPHIKRWYNVNGVFDGETAVADLETDAYSFALLVHKRAWMFGDRRQARIENARNIFTGATGVVLTQRLDFQSLFPADEPSETILVGIPSLDAVAGGSG